VRPSVWSEIFLYVCFFLAVGFGMIGMIEAVSVRKKINTLSNRLRQLHTEEARRTKSPYQRLAARLNKSEYGKELDDKLKSANLKIAPFEWMLIRAAALLVITILLYKLIGLKFPFNVTAGYFVMNFGGKQWLKTRSSKYAQLINRQLPEVCRMMASCIRAGLSVQQAIEMVAKELKPPAGPLFQSMSSELKMGTTLDAVLERLHERFTSKDIRLMAQTILVQRQAGGNLSQALDHLAKTLEDRERMNQELSNQTAESRYIALTLAMMPFFLIIAFNMVFKGFITPVFTLPGMILLVIVLALMITGFLLIRKVSNIKA
jgi:tight adherence protein B